MTLDRAPPPKNRRRPSFNKPITALDAFELMETPETQGKNDPQKYQQTKVLRKVLSIRLIICTTQLPHEGLPGCDDASPKCYE